MLLMDTSGLLALLDSGERDHAKVSGVIDAQKGPLLCTDLVFAETDFLVLDRLGARAELEFVSQVEAGALHREPVTPADFVRAVEIITKYADQEFGITDATLMALAERLGCPVVTLDRRHFAAFRTRKAKPLKLLP